MSPSVRLRHQRQLLLWQAKHDPRVRRGRSDRGFDVYVASLRADVEIALAAPRPSVPRRACQAYPARRWPPGASPVRPWFADVGDGPG